MAYYVDVADLFNDGSVEGLEVQNAVAQYVSDPGGGGAGGPNYVNVIGQNAPGRPAYSNAGAGPNYVNTLGANAPSAGGGGGVSAYVKRLYANRAGPAARLPVVYNPATYSDAGQYVQQGGGGAYSSPGAPPAPRPGPRPDPPLGARTPTIQSAGGQTRSVLRMDATGFQHDRDHQDTVVYMDAQRRAKHEVTMGARLTRRGATFDTATIRKAFAAKARAGESVHRPGQAALGGGISPEEMRRWNRESLIWVCSSGDAGTRPKFYSGVGKINHIHHSSFTGGQEVVGAGEWIVIGGELKFVSANSGHYRPTLDALYASVLQMAEAFNADTQVMMYDTRGAAWVYRPVKEFISRPSDGGRYKVHPFA